MIHPADGDDAGGRADRCDASSRRVLHAPAAAGRPRGRGTSSASTATRARTTPSSSSRRAPRAARRSRRARRRPRELGRAIEAVARDLARQQAADGEGATTLITCQVSGAIDDADARAVARAVVSSSLVKAAAHGRDPNWGRIAGAAGNARLADAAVLEAAGLARADAERAAGARPASIRIGSGSRSPATSCSTVPTAGPVAFDRAAARAAMDAPEILIRLDLGLGDGTGEAFGCDLTEAYVIENSEYTT